MTDPANPFARRPGFGRPLDEVVPVRPAVASVDPHAPPNDWRSMAGPDSRDAAVVRPGDHVLVIDQADASQNGVRDVVSFPPVPEAVRVARMMGDSAAKRAAIREIAAGRGEGEALEPTAPPMARAPAEPYEPVLPGTKSPADLSAALAMIGLRRLERALYDYDARVSLEAARVLATVAPRVAELPNPMAPDITPEAKVAAIRASLGLAPVVALVLDEAARPGSPLRDALMTAGWCAPEDA